MLVPTIVTLAPSPHRSSSQAPPPPQHRGLLAAQLLRHPLRGTEDGHQTSGEQSSLALSSQLSLLSMRCACPATACHGPTPSHLRRTPLTHRLSTTAPLVLSPDYQCATPSQNSPPSCPPLPHLPLSPQPLSHPTPSGPARLQLRPLRPLQRHPILPGRRLRGTPPVPRHVRRRGHPHRIPRVPGHLRFCGVGREGLQAQARPTATGTHARLYCCSPRTRGSGRCWAGRPRCPLSRSRSGQPRCPQPHCQC